jgi:DHA3 family macrolide efflux protein-like MFS transporter
MRILQPLRSAPVALLWGGLSLSAIGDQLYVVALSWIAVGVLGPAAGYLAALQAGALTFAVLSIGRWADRWDPRRSMVAADLARAAVLAGVVGWWLATGAVGVVQLAGAVIVLAFGQALFRPALQTMLLALVPDPHMLPPANGLLDATDRTARLLGPGMIALLAGIIPVMHFLTLDALGFLASATALLAIGRLRPTAGRPEAPARAEAVWQAVVRGVRATAGHRLLGFVLATTGVVNGAWYASLFLGLPLLITERGIGGPGGSGLGAYGLVISAYGCTNLAANLIFGSRALPARPQFQMFGGSLLVGIGTALVGLAGLLPAAVALPAMAGAAAFGAFGGPMKDIPVAVLRQTRIAPGDVAAAMRVYMAANSIGALVAMLIAPSACAAFGIVPVIVGCGGVMFAIGLIGLARHADWVEAVPA